jgi:hypothetical protein
MNIVRASFIAASLVAATGSAAAETRTNFAQRVEFCVPIGSSVLPEMGISITSAPHAVANSQSRTTEIAGCDVDISIELDGASKKLRPFTMKTGEQKNIIIGTVRSGMKKPVVLTCDGSGNVSVDLAESGATAGACAPAQPDTKSCPAPDNLDALKREFSI